MNDAVAHRGPDGEGVLLKKNFAFGHRRLSILDLSDAGRQPMHWNDRLSIIFNGEIYNYIEVRKELKSHGYLFKTSTDTEVVLAAYDKWGTNCVSKFNGMWAFAIYDDKQNIIFCSRDRFGIKPFYYTDSGNIFAFGSEIKQLIPFEKELSANKQILFDYLFLGYHQHTNETFFKNIQKLGAGHNLIFNLESNTVKITRYYRLEADDKLARYSEQQTYEYMEELLKESVSLHLRSDVPVGTCLSGGLDSSYIAAQSSLIYHESSSGRFHAITAKSTQPEYDETSFAEKVVSHAGLHWTITEPSTNNFFDNLDSIIKIQEEPFGGPSILMQYYVMAEAKKVGCKVMLDGQGGDEIFLGYERYYVNYLANQNLFSSIKSFSTISKNSKLTLKDVLLYKVYFGQPSVRASILRRRASYMRPEHFSYFNQDLIRKVSSNQRLDFLQSYEINHSQLPHLLQYEDKNSMWHSIEARVPFVNHRIIEAAYSLPIQYKIRDGWTKFILRKVAEKILPPEISWRKTKLGFNAPKEMWMSNQNFFETRIQKAAISKELLSNGKLEKIPDINSLWRLFNVTQWFDLFNVDFK